MIGLWAEVYDAAYTARIADSDLLLSRATVERNLDGPGRVSIETPVLHLDYTARAVTMLTVKRVVEVWYRESEDTAKQLKAAFVIEDVAFSEQSGGVKFAARGSDVMILLMNTTTNLARIYENVAVNTVVSGLLTLAGWSVTFNLVSGNITTRFDGTSVLKAIQAIAKETGQHFRLTDTHKQIEFGALGDDSGYRVVKVEGDKPMPARGDNVIPLETVDIKTVGTDIVNWVIAMGSGKGDSTLTLEHSTRSSPYTIQTMTGPDGRTVYFIKDNASIASYGQIEKRVNFKKIGPVGTSETQIEQAANFLYDAAAEWLSRRVDPLTEVGARTFQQRVNFTVGDKVRFEYIKRANVGGSPITLQSIDADYWVMGTRESFGESGETATLELVNIDYQAEQNEDIVVGQVDAIEVQDVGYQPSLNLYMYGPYQEPMDSSEDAVMTFKIPDQMLDLFYVELQVTTVPFSSTAKSSAHRHLMMQYTNSTTDRALNTLYTVALDGGGLGTDTLAIHANGAFTDDVYTFGAAGAQEYGIYKDTDYPDNVDIDVNGTSVETGLDSGGTGLTDYSIDITDEIKNKAGGFRATHTITFSCDGGQGEVQAQIVVQGAIIMGKAT